MRVFHEHPWTPLLALTLKNCTRAIERGMGPSRKAVPFRLDLVAELPEIPGGKLRLREPHMPQRCALISAWWLLRGAETAALTVKQAVVCEQSQEATLCLGATKTDFRGDGCRRTLGCICNKETERNVLHRICPYHLLAAHVGQMTGRAALPDQPLFPDVNGEAISRAGWRRAFMAATSLKVSEHSPRRSGAKWLAMCGLSEDKIQFLGRWGSETVRRYIAEARANLTASWSRELSLPKWFGTGLQTQSRKVRCMTRARLKVRLSKFAQSVRRRTEAQVRLAIKELELKPAPTIVTYELVRRRGGKTLHAVDNGHPSVPVDAWRTICGWEFGLAQHCRAAGPAAEATCMRCHKLLQSRLAPHVGQVGGS